MRHSKIQMKVLKVQQSIPDDCYLSICSWCQRRSRETWSLRSWSKDNTAASQKGEKEECSNYKNLTRRRTELQFVRNPKIKIATLWFNSRDLSINLTSTDTIKVQLAMKFIIFTIFQSTHHKYHYNFMICCVIFIKKILLTFFGQSTKFLQVCGNIFLIFSILGLLPHNSNVISTLRATALPCSSYSNTFNVGHCRMPLVTEFHHESKASFPSASPTDI
ncbi:uncharacterized protein [Narcine bancroftii]|uniref:uncharacterized protein n=1 Tax=Narcine bancroftii TaxID=1343680 RepID=UPI003831FDD1